MPFTQSQLDAMSMNELMRNAYVLTAAGDIALRLYGTGGGGGGGTTYTGGNGITVSGSVISANASATYFQYNAGSLEIKAGVFASASHTHTVSQITDYTTATDSRADARIAAQKGAVNGLAPLDGTGKVASSYLPSYVDDVLEYANLAAFPGT